jgi:hypothetical protein
MIARRLATRVLQQLCNTNGAKLDDARLPCVSLLRFRYRVSSLRFPHCVLVAPFSPISMLELLLFHLLWILALLALVLGVCCVVNWFWPDESLDGVRIFVTVAAFALVFDAALTFLVFADSQQRYGTFSSAIAFAGRACAYGLAATAGFCFARLRKQRQSRRFEALRMNAAR